MTAALPRNDPARIDRILAAVAERTGVPVAEIEARGPAGDRGRKEVAAARHAFYWVAYRSGAGTLSLAAIGARLPRTWHAVSHGVRRMDAMREADPELRRMTDELRSRFSTGKEKDHGRNRHDLRSRTSRTKDKHDPEKHRADPPEGREDHQPVGVDQEIQHPALGADHP
jgi:hypothetical protein